MDPLELIAVGFGILSVWLSTREHIAAWPTALVNTALYFIILGRAQLYANAWLQVFYFTLSLYGWYQWKYGGSSHSGVQVSRASPRLLLLLAGIAVAATLLIGGGLARFTDASLPWPDAATTAVSLVAQWMLTRKLRENWAIWIGVNVAYIAMYLHQSMWPTAGLYVAFLLLAIHGWRQWGATLRAREATYHVVLTGPENSGKTTLAQAIAERHGAPWVPEGARRFVETDPTPLSAETVEPIAKLAMGLDDAARVGAPTLLVHDTDLVSTVVYARHYYGHCPDWIVSEARARRADLYLLCLPDLPWEADGVRDRPTKRAELLAMFRDELRAMDADVIEIGGQGEARLAAALSALASRRPPRPGA
ncbi:MAG: nicotinamide riboside transporter PnuC [Gemmatimonadaceae bacterium]|nr:nicotinamide riboside transporter PnuC [Gemmatimonadaceae bacterium]MCW5826684.1 nicotinamide riboside transporter PnuC [Gemmatimonadaceae bacterium]